MLQAGGAGSLYAAPAKEHLTGLAELDPELSCLSPGEIKIDAGTEHKPRPPAL